MIWWICIIGLVLIMLVIIAYKVRAYHIAEYVNKHRFHLYKDYILIIDESNDKPKIKFGWVIEVNNNEVKVRLADGGEAIAVWIPDKNNFFFKDQLKNL